MTPMTSNLLKNNHIERVRTPSSGKVSVKVPVDDWICQKMNKLNVTVATGYPSRMADSSGLPKDHFVKFSMQTTWYDMHSESKEVKQETVKYWHNQAARLNSTYPRVARACLAHSGNPLKPSFFQRQ